VFILKFVGRVGLGLLDIGLGQEMWSHVHLCIGQHIPGRPTEAAPTKFN